MKIKGFTLVEMLMAMALTGVIVSLAWFVFGHFQQMGSKLKTRNDRATELSLLHFALWKDCQKAAAFKIQGSAVSLYASQDELIASYAPADSVLIRQSQLEQRFALPGVTFTSGTDQSFFLMDSLGQHRLHYRIEVPAQARASNP